MKSKKENRMEATNLVICDWGSSHLRAYHVSSDGEILGKYESSRGVKSLSREESLYRDELNKALKALQVDTSSEIRISGMASSKHGWKEVDYCTTPVGKNELALNFKSLAGFKNGRIYGGAMHQCEDGSVDVMRGEEIQILGILEKFPDAGLLCLPGTHSKWVEVQDGKITAFKTYMTGDLFHSLCEESIFKGQITSRDFDEDGFIYGCRLALDGSDLQDLFKLRSAYVFSEISSDAFHSCLSGFLIMNELRSVAPKTEVHLCGSVLLEPLYVIALKEIGIECLAIDSEQATILGHLALLSS